MGRLNACEIGQEPDRPLVLLFWHGPPEAVPCSLVRADCAPRFAELLSPLLRFFEAFTLRLI